MNINVKEKIEKATDLMLSKTSTETQRQQGHSLLLEILEQNPPEEVRFLSMVLIKDKVKKEIYDSVKAIEHTNFLMQRESHERTGLSFMPLAESKAIRSSEASRSIPSSNIKFRATETLDPIIQKMVHSKDTIDNLPKFIDLINKVAVPHLKTVYEDLKLGIQLEEKKKKKSHVF